MNENTSNVIPTPRFKNWTKPKTVLEALERSLLHARNEAKWTTGAWFDVPAINHHPGVDSLENAAKVIEGMACTDVKACAAGIIAIEVLDGEALFNYVANNTDFNDHILKDDPIAWGAVELLATAFDEEFKGDEQEQDDDGGGYYRHADALERIISRNDRGYIGNSKHHQRIVKCFEGAVALAKERQP